MVENNNSNKPVKVYKAGVLSLSVWENLGDDGSIMKSFTVQRAYKDKKDVWQHTNTLRSSDLLKLKVLIDEAYRDYVFN